MISHGYTGGFHAEFDWTGTFDPTGWLSVPESIRYMGSLLPGGWPELMARNRALALHGRKLLLEALELEAPCPETMIGSMASIPLPPAATGSAAARLDFQGLHDWMRERNVEICFHPTPVLMVRISAQLYNTLDQYQQLAALLREVLRG